MKRAPAIFGAIVCFSLPAAADSHFQEQAHEAFSNAQVFEDYSVPAAQDILEVPVETDLPQSSMGVATLEEAGALATLVETTQAATYSLMGDNAVEWSVQSASQGDLTLADQAVSGPQALTTNTTFTSDGGICTVTDFEDAPLITRVCDLIRDHAPGTVTQTANITVFRTEIFQCHITPTGPLCDALGAAPICQLTDQVCTLSDGTTGDCLEVVASYTCVSDAPMAFAAPQVGATTWSEPIFTWVETQSAQYAPERCVSPQTVCPGGASVQDINGLLVPVQCMEYETTYDCAVSTYSSHCEAFETLEGCVQVSSDCYDVDPDGVCGTYEATYECGSDGETTAYGAACEAVNVCVNDFCQSVEPEADTSLPLSLSYIDLLNSMADEWSETEDRYSFEYVDGEFQLVLIPGGELQYFNSIRRTCRKSILGAVNCCRDSGWAVGTFTQCSEGELALIAAQQAGTTVYLRTYCSSKALFFCIERRREYCVFNSRIGREVNYQVQLQINGTFECRGLLHEEMEAVDWSAIDLSSAFSEMLANVGDLDAGDLTSLIQSNISLAAPEVVDSYE